MANWPQNNWPQNNTMVAFINDDSTAVNYPVSPGYTVALINANDPDNGKMYLKSAQPNGCPNPMRIFQIKDVTPQRENADVVSRTEFDKVVQMMQQQQQRIEQLLAANGGKEK